MSSRHFWCVVVLLLGVHAGLGLHAAWRQSPVWDEVVYPASGWDLQRTGRIRFSHDHPPLGKILLSLPYWLLRPLPAVAQDSSPDAFRSGFEFLHANGQPARDLILLPRLMALLFSWGLGLGVCLWTRRLAGDAAALVALGFYAGAPPILARASLALLDIPLVFFMTGSLWAFTSYKESPTLGRAVAWIGLWAAAVLTKATGWLLLPIFFGATLIRFCGRGEKDSALRTVWACVFAAFTVVAVAEIVQRAFGASYWTHHVMARGSDLVLSRVPVYFAGRIWEKPLFFFSLWAFLIKTPVAFWLAGLAGLPALIQRRSSSWSAAVLLAAGIFGFIQLLSVHSIIATVHTLWGIPLLMIVAGSGLVHVWRQGGLGRGVAAVMGLSVVAGLIGIPPNYGAYFNVLAGGSKRGSYWLSDSDQDWGQGLPAVKSWMDQRKLDHIILAYSGAGDPRIYDIVYQDLVSPALISRYFRGGHFTPWEGPVWVVIGTKVLQSEPALFAWLTVNRQPTQRIGQVFYAYDLTADPEGQEWLAAVYAATGRPGFFRISPAKANAAPRESIPTSTTLPTRPGMKL